MPEIESSWMEGFYSHLFSRDLVFFFAGGLFISIFEYALWGKIDFPQQISLELIGFLAISYVVGLALNNIAQTKIYSVEKYFIDTLYKPPYDYKSYLVILQDLVEFYDKRVLNQLERSNYHMVLGYAVGAASLFGGAVMLIVAIGRLFVEKISPLFSYILLAIILLIFGNFLLNYGKDSYIEEQQHEAALIDEIKSRKK